MTPPGLEHAIFERSRQLGLSIPPTAFQSLGRYFQLLARWNQRINLTGLNLEAPAANTLDRLLFEPLIAAGSVRIKAGRWFDIGSGGGSPAIPIRIVCPGLH